MIGKVLNAPQKCESKTFSHDFAIPQKLFQRPVRGFGNITLHDKAAQDMLRGIFILFCFYMSLFRHHKRYLKYKESVQDYILKYLAKREAVSEKMPVDQRWQ